jgi:hypothetical protein
MKLDFDKNNMPVLLCEFCNDSVTLKNGILAAEESPDESYLMNPGVYHDECLLRQIDIYGDQYRYFALNKLIMALLQGVGVSESTMSMDIEKEEQWRHLGIIAAKENQ